MTVVPSQTAHVDDLLGSLETHRRALTGFCYRMLASGSEAEDAVQETMLRAWRAADGFDGRSSARTWLYRIASNVCIDMLRSPQRRARPMDLGPSIPQRGAVPSSTREVGDYVMPVLSSQVIDLSTDPAELAAARESVRLAFVAALQHLPPRQRAALILCEVLRWSANEVAQLLDTTTASVNSALQRARATLAMIPSEPLDSLDDPRHQALLVRYVEAFERYDIPALVAMLRADAVLSMPPYDMWLQGADDIGRWFGEQGIGCQGARLVAAEANGTAAFGSYRVAGPGRWEPFGFQVLDVVDGQVVGHHNFLYPDRFAEFGLPPFLAD